MHNHLCDIALDSISYMIQVLVNIFSLSHSVSLGHGIHTQYQGLTVP